MTIANQGPNDDKDLKEIAEFIDSYMKYAEEVFFKGHIEDVGVVNPSKETITKEDFKKNLDSWLDGYSKDQGELIKALASGLKKDSANNMHKSFSNVLETEKNKYASVDENRLPALKKAIAGNEYVQRSNTLREASKNFDAILVCEVLAKVCESFDMIKTDNFFIKAASSLKERVNSYRQEYKTTIDTELGKLSPSALETLKAIRVRPSSQSISQDGSKTVEITATKKQVSSSIAK